jgi:hypothetical protein
MTFLEIFGIWFATAMTLFMLSFLYKDNPFYRFGEHIFVGVTIGYILVINVTQALWDDWILGFGRQDGVGLILAHAVPGLLGVLALARIVPKLNWLSRPTFAFVIGYGAGTAIPRAVDAFVLKHTSKTVSPILSGTEGVGFWEILSAFSNLLVVVIVLCVLVYFFFSIEHKGPVRVATRLGILFLMVAFGIAYGNTVMGRMSLLYGRFFELKQNSGSDAGFATPILLVLTILGLIVYDVRSRGGPEGGGASPAVGPPPVPEGRAPQP